MSKNIMYQFKEALQEAYEPGRDKHSDKQHLTKAERAEIIYSGRVLKANMDNSYNFGKFLKENYSIRNPVDITRDMAQAWLNTKTHCTQQSIGQYKSSITKLEVVLRRKGVVVNWKGIVEPQSKYGKAFGEEGAVLRTIQMDPKHYAAIVRYGIDNKTKSKAHIAIQFAGRFGMRVHETVKVQTRDFRETKDGKYEIKIIGKGKKIRILEISKEDYEWLKSISRGKKPNQKICDIKENSVNKYLARVETKIGIRKKYAEHKTSVHAIRKMRAQQVFDEWRKKGLTQNQALGKVNIYLGHNDDRDVVKKYVKNIW